MQPSFSITFDDQLKELARRFDDAFTNFPSNKLRYCSPKTVKNLLHHLPSIKGRSEKQDILNKLSLYCTILEQQYPEELDASIAAQLFQDHLYNITNTFSWRLGFIPVLSIYFIVIAIPIVTTVLYLFYTIHYYLFLSGLILLIIYIIINFIKRLQKKVFGILY